MTDARGSTPSRRRVAALVALTAAVPVLTGCVVPATPDRHGWFVHGERATGTVVSALGTAALTLREQRGSDLLPNYARVTVAQAEEAAAGAAGAWSAEQPPPAQQDRAGRVGDILDRADGLISDARTALLNNDPHACDRYCPRLRKMSTRVQRIEQALAADAARVTVGH
ncbi:MAG: hypothetical protein ACTHNS_04320 [Marmoricola sp.]